MMYIRILYRAPAKYMQAMHIRPYEQTCMHAHTHGYIRMLPTHTHAPHIHTTYMHHTNTMHRPHIHITHTYTPRITSMRHTYNNIQHTTTHEYAIHTHTTLIPHLYHTRAHSCGATFSPHPPLFVVKVFRRRRLHVVVGHRRRRPSSSSFVVVIENCGGETRYTYPYTPQVHQDSRIQARNPQI